MSKPPTALDRHVRATRAVNEVGFAHDVLKLVSGTTLAQLVTMLAAPIVARLYDPAAFGTASIFGSVAGTIGVIACLRYEAAIMLPRSDEDAANLLVGSLMFVVLISSLMVPFVWVARYPAQEWLVRNGLLRYVWLVPLGVFVSGALLALTFWQTRRRRYGRMSITRIVGAGAGTGTQLVWGASGHAGAGGLVLANLIGPGLPMGILGVLTWREDGRLIRESFRLSRLGRALSQYRKFPLYSSWSILFYEAAWQLPTFWLASVFSAPVVGYYAVGTRLLRVPMNVIGGAVGQVFLERAAKAKDSGSLSSVVEATFRGLTTLGLFPLLIVMLCGKDLFIVVLGARWAEAGVYSQILALWMFFWFVSSPIMQLINVLEKQEWGLLFNVVLLISRAAALATGGFFGSARLAMILLGVAGVLTYGYLDGRLMAEAGYRWSTSGTVLLKRGLLFVPAAGAILAVKQLGASPLVTSLVAAGCGCAYLTYVLRYDPEARRLLRSARRRADPGYAGISE